MLTKVISITPTMLMQNQSKHRRQNFQSNRQFSLDGADIYDIKTGETIKDVTEMSLEEIKELVGNENEFRKI